MHFRLVGRQFSQHASQAQGIFAQCGTRPFAAGGGGVAFVEDQVEHGQDRVEPFLALFGARHFEGYACVSEGALGAHDALRDRRFGREEGAGDFGGRQAAQEAQGQCDACFGRQHGVAGHEQEAQQVVVDVVVFAHGVGERGGRLEFGFELAADFLMLALEQLAPAQVVDGAVLGHRGEPGARVGGNAALRPAFQCGDQGILRQLLSQPDFAHHARHRGDDPGGFDPPDRVDGAMDGAIGHLSRYVFCGVEACSSLKPSAACCTSGV